MGLTTILPIIFGIGMVLTLGTSIAPSVIENVKISKVHNKTISNEEKLLDAIQRYLIVEQQIPTLNTLITNGYINEKDTFNGFDNQQFDFSVNTDTGIVTLVSTISDPNAKRTYVNSYKNSNVVLEKPNDIVETHFVLPTNILHDYNKHMDNIPISSVDNTPDPTTNKYWYKNENNEVILMVSDGFNWFPLSSSLSGGNIKNIEASIQDIISDTSPKEKGDIKYAYDSNTNSIQEFVYMGETQGWVAKGGTMTTPAHYSDNPYMDSVAIGLGFTTKSGVQLTLCNSNKHWCKSEDGKLINSNLEVKNANEVVAINEQYNYFDNNCDNFIQDPGSTKNHNLCKVTENAYIDNEAITLGRAKQGGILLDKCNENKYWCNIGTNNVVDKDLNVRDYTVIVPMPTPTYAGYHAIPCDGRNCYNNNLAKTIGIALNGDNNLLKFDGTFWSKENDNNQLVDNSNSYFSKSLSGVIGISQNLIYYDNCVPNYYTCFSKGMRLPTLAETRASNSSGISSCNTWSWTSTESTYAGGNWAFYGTSLSETHSYGSDKGYTYARCVK